MEQQTMTPIQKALLARAANRAAGISTRVDNPIIRNQNEPGRKNAIFAMCARCMGCTKDSIEPGFKKDIRTCTDKECPIFPFRPYQKGDESSEEG